MRHKLRGWGQLLSDIEYLYPKRITYGFFLLGLALVVSACWRYHATTNPRLLAGDELRLGHATFTAIKAADDAAEDFANPSQRRKAVAEATTQLANFQQYARTAEEMHAGTIMSYYLDEVRHIPDLDLECAKAMQVAQQVGEKAASDPLLAGDQLSIAEVGELTCLSARSQAVAIKNLCRDETLSYIIPNRQPPVDQCTFRHMAQSDLIR